MNTIKTIIPSTNGTDLDGISAVKTLGGKIPIKTDGPTLADGPGLTRLRAFPKAETIRQATLNEQIAANDLTKEKNTVTKKKKAKLLVQNKTATKTAIAGTPKFIKNPHETARASALLKVIKTHGGQATKEQITQGMSKEYKPGTVGATIYDMNFDGWIKRVSKGTYAAGPRLAALAG